MKLKLIANRRANAYLVIALLCGLLAIPSLAWGAGSGAGSPASSGGGSITPASAPSVQLANQTVTASGDGITLSTMSTAMLRNGLTFTGTTSSSEAGQTVEIERLWHETNWQWTPTVTTTVASDGSFSGVWLTNHIGRFQIRAVLGQPSAADVSTAAPTVTTTVYRPSLATQYGPGLYGRRTACGQRLHRNTIGIANRFLPCGSQVALEYGGRTMVVTVIDRGPYANGADWDLTTATGRALGIDGTAKIGAVSLPAQPTALAAQHAAQSAQP